MSTEHISEQRLEQLRREAELKGRVEVPGVLPAGAPFPTATPETGYYGLPLLKPPQWTWEVPAYFFVGGVAGSAAVVSAVANWTGGGRRLARHARWVAGIGAALSPPLLISDLGRPERFLNMLRVFKWRSAMSMGSWLLFAFSNAAIASSFAQVVEDRYRGRFRVRLLDNAVGAFGRTADALSAATGLFFANYTGVLIGATAVPVWNDNVTTLPLHFAASGMGACCGLLELMGHDRSRALNALATGAAFWETMEGANLEMRRDRVLDPLKHGQSGWLTRAGGVLSGPVPLLLRGLAAASRPGRARNIRRAAAASAIAGSLLTRLGWWRAGYVSTADPRLPLELPDDFCSPGCT